VSTLAGSELAAFADGLGSHASFNSPLGIAIDASGLAYVADFANNRVRQIMMSTGAVTTLAGSGAFASTDGNGTFAAFSSPTALALDGRGNLYVTDSGANLIRRVVLATQEVTTVAGSGAANFLDGIGVAAAFNSPQGIACDASGNAYVADTSNSRIRKMVLSSGAVTTFAGSFPGSLDAVGTNARFSSVSNVALDASGLLLFATDGNKIRQIVIATQLVSTLAGSPMTGATNGVGTNARFNAPWGMVFDLNGNLLISDSGGSVIRQIVIATKTVTTLAGAGSSSWFDSFGTNAAFNRPFGMAMDARGNVLLADSSNHRIRVLCTRGSYCAVAGLSAPNGTCDSGHYCVTGSSTATQHLCMNGTYCPRGSHQPTVCPDFRLLRVQWSWPTIRFCTAGYYCNVTGLSAVAGGCAAGFYCPDGVFVGHAADLPDSARTARR
jgi:sugar lactone lactonase YvrE